MATDEELRQEAVERIKERRGFYVHLGAYFIVNAALFALCAIIGGGYYWPMWTLLGWGIGVAFHGLAVLIEGQQLTDERVQREMAKMRGGMSGPTTA